MLPATHLNGKHLVLGVSALTAAVFLLYGQVLLHMAKQWLTDPDYSHGFLVPILSVYLLWRKKDTLNPRAVEPSLIGLTILASGLILFVLGKAGTLIFFMQISFIIVLLGLCLFVLGSNIYKSIFFPVTYLIFMIPLPSVLYNDLTFHLTILASLISSTILPLFGIPAVREGNIIHLTYTSLHVVDACSGLRSLMSLLALAVLLAYLTQRSVCKKLCLVFVTIPIAVFANSCRLTATAVFVEFFGPTATEGPLHLLSGMIMFGIASMLLLSCGLILKRTR